MHLFSAAQSELTLARRLMIAGWLLWVLSYFPADHYAPWLSFYSEALAVLALMLLAAGLLAARVRWQFPVWMWPLSGLLLLRVWLGPCASAGAACGVQLLPASYLLLLLLAVAAGQNWALRLGRASWAAVLAGGLLLAALGSAAIVWMQWRLQDTLGLFMLVNDGVLQPRGNLGQPNHVATLMGLGLAALMGLYEWRRIGAITLGFAALFLGVSVVMTESRTGTVALLLLCAWHGVMKQRAGLRLGWVPVLAYAGVIVLLTWTWEPLNLWLDGATSIRGEARNQVGLRPIMWAQMGLALWQAPWWGYGWLQTGQAQNAVAHGFATAESTQYAHNLALDLMIWNGVPLGLLLLCAIVAWAWRRMQQTRDALDWAALAMLLPMAAHSMLEYPHAYAYFLLPAGMLVGLREAELTASSLSVWGQRAWTALLLAWALWMAQLGWDYLHLEEEYRLTRFELMHIGKQPEGHVPYVPRVATQLGRLLQALHMPLAVHMTPDQLHTLQAAATEFPMRSTLQRYVKALALNAQEDEALRQLEVMRAYFGEPLQMAVKDEVMTLRAQAGLPPELRSGARP